MAKKNTRKAKPVLTQEQHNEELRKEARELFEKIGRQSGRVLDNWWEA